MNSFLPEGTSIPSASGNYMKLENGENRFRIMSSAIVGYELWIDHKPVRHKKPDFTPNDLSSADDNKFKPGEKMKPVYFWAFTVWNYKEEKIQILEIKQVTIMRQIESYLHDDDFGDPKGYDFVITQFEGDNGKIQYSVKAKPPKKMDEGISVYANDLKINLNALYEGKDPFAPDVTDSDLDEISKNI